MTNLDEAKIYGTDLQSKDVPRLRGQLKKVFDLMIDGRKRTTYEISDWLHIPAASAHRHLSTLRTQFGYSVEKKLLSDGLWLYWIAGKNPDNKPQFKKKIPPLGDRVLFGELLRLIIACSYQDDLSNRIDYHDALNKWGDDMIERAKTGKF